MKFLAKKVIPLSIFLIIAVLPTILFAQTINNQGGSTVNNPVTLQNPLAYNSIQSIVSALLTAVEYIGGILCALYIIWAGFLFVKARGNPEELEGAKKTITHALIGTAIILGASVILTIITNTVAAIKS